MSRQKLSRISGLLRWLVIFSLAIVLMYIGYFYFAHDEIRFFQKGLFDHLWVSEEASRPLLWLILTPSLIIMFSLVYWLQKLLGLYQSGDFFGNRSMSCYLWLVWINVASLVLDILETLVVGFYHRSLFGKTEIELVIDFGDTFIVILMLLIVHMLKAAKEIEDENKGFV